jgi:hypothetical protein
MYVSMYAGYVEFSVNYIRKMSDTLSGSSAKYLH